MDQTSKERRNKKSTSNENLDAVKAAAHAWFEHVSSLSGRKLIDTPISPSVNFSQSSRPAATSYFKNMPSRFKLEAASGSWAFNDPVRSGLVNKMRHSLLDEYEVERIVQDLDDYSSKFSCRRRREAAKEESIIDMSNKNNNKQLQIRKESRSSSWARRGLACSTNVNDVVVATRRATKSTRSGRR